ncbi:MAG: tRNA threonylcarbamoyladenosine dehydratase [Alphaproteobacteria bacterium]|nr:tRNA threonylcarbamoyladenosine dehydratase [Alphaproteobacteria bacterium]
MYDERFSRIQLMIGDEGLERLINSHVAVIGLGAVGSYATEALVRSGIGRLRLIDFDEISKTNINRHLYAMESTIGKPKKDVAEQRSKDINPACKVEALDCFVNPDTMDKVLEGKPDIVIDAIDSLGPKVELLIALEERNIPVISCLGAALRTDPSQIKVGAMKKTQNCPLAKMVRKRLRRRGASLDFTCVYSTEPTHTIREGAVMPESESEENFYDKGRKRRTMGSLPTITGIVGLIAANTAINMLLEEKR